MEAILILSVVAFALALSFGGKEKPSDLPPFTKSDADNYLKNFDYWNKKTKSFNSKTTE